MNSTTSKQEKEVRLVSYLFFNFYFLPPKFLAKFAFLTIAGE
jgi:hypothetical protein